LITRNRELEQGEHHVVLRLDTRHRLALAFGIINVMWLEANYAFGRRKAENP
jgi:predicted outer membrane lipoprotein